MPLIAEIAGADTAWLQYPAIALLAGVLWWLGRVIRDAQKDHKETILHMATQHTTTVTDINTQNRETISMMMARHDAESVRRDARCDKEHEKRDEIACEMKTAIEALADEIRNRK